MSNQTTIEKPKQEAPAKNQSVQVNPGTQSYFKQYALTAVKTFKTIYGEKADAILAKEIQFAFQAADKNRKLLSCNPESIQYAVTNVALTGLSLNPVTGLAYLVPRGKDATLVPSYMGMIEVLRKSGSIKSISAEAVYEGDEFTYKLGTDAFINHVPRLDRKGDEPVIAAYAVAQLMDGGYEVELMGKSDIDKRKDVATTSMVWDKWYGEMAKKTAIRALYKRLPKSEKATKIMELFDTVQNSHTVPVEKVQEEFE